MNHRKLIANSSRRSFLTDAAAGAAVVALGATVPKPLCLAATQSRGEKILVVVEMAGGNDGLNSVVPHADPAYQAAREKTAIKKQDTLAVNETIGLHPSLRGFADLLEDGKFGIIQGVGYDNPNRSHFESMDIWHSCFRNESPRHDGWLGRYLDAAELGAARDPAALHLGAEKQPFALMSRDVRVPSIQSLEQFRLNGSDRATLRDAIRDLSAQDRNAANDLLGFIQSSTLNAIASSERMESAGVKYKPDQAYPASKLGKKLETVAKLIASGLETRVYYVRIDGFDTHANQPDAHAALLREVSEAVSTLIRDVEAHGNGDRVIAMCFSEFGRRVAENASNGTDHGTAGPIFLAGTKVRAGLVGEHPSLTDLDNGDLKHHTDFRQVYAAILQGWPSTSSESVLGAKFEPVKIFS